MPAPHRKRNSVIKKASLPGSADYSSANLEGRFSGTGPARRFSPKEKLLILDEVKRSGQKVSDVCKKWGISRFTFYNWAKNWRDPSNLRRANLLKEKRPNGKNHPKAIAGKREKLILECVLRNPGWSSHKIEKFLAEYLGGAFKVSNHGIQNVLNRNSLNCEEARFEYSRSHLTRSVFPNKFTDFEKYKIIEEYLIKGGKIAQVCRQFHISRFTFYAWLKKYEVEKTVSSLADRRLRAESHPRYAGEAVRQKVLDAVGANPAFSVHKIHAHLAGVVGHHAIQNILAREDLNTFTKRQLFAQGYVAEPQVAVAPLYEVPVPKLSVWRMLYAPFRTVPKWVLKHPATWPVVFPTLAFLAYIFEVDKLARPQMFFPIIALTFGFIFFLYSLKYYISLIIVMRLAQGGQKEEESQSQSGKSKISIILRAISHRLRVEKFIGSSRLGSNNKISQINPLLMNLDRVKLDSAVQPFVSIHVAVYNEKKVVERLIEACKNQRWQNFEVILADDSTDETTEIAKKALSSGGRRLESTFKNETMEIFVSKVAKNEGGPIFKLIHRFNRDGFKGAALQKALENTNPYADFIVVFDSDFVPYADTVEQFVKAFQALGGFRDQGLGDSDKSKPYTLTPNTSNNIAAIQGYQSSFAKASEDKMALPGSNIAAIQGYQWHVLNKSENWVTRGVRTEYAGSYVVERAGIGIYGGLNMIAGSVFCLRADVLRKFGWGRSITEDLELTLRLYEAGYKVLFTPYIQAPAEAVSTVKRLIRQRMRWAEGHTFNIRKMWTRIFASPHVSPREKFEFLYLSPYYLQAAFFIFGSLAWFISEVVLKVHLPFWTAAWGWSLVFVNFLSLPLMNLIGLFLEESDERDYLGIASFIVLSYILVPFQAYAAVKALIEDKEGPWFRTPKTGAVTDVFDRVRFYNWFEKLKVWKGKPAVLPADLRLKIDDLRGNLALALNEGDSAPSAFNAFSGYSFKPKRMRFVARGVLSVLLISVMLLNYFAFFVPQTEAHDSTVHLEQQINIINQEYNNTTTSYAPTTEQLGLVKWESSKYDGTVTVYFEAIINTAASSNTTTAGLFAEGNTTTPVSGSTVTTTSTSYTKVRSGSITLTDATNYTARVKGSSTNGARIKVARLIITQNPGTGKIGKTRTYVEIGSNSNETTTGAPKQADGHKRFCYDSNTTGNGRGSCAAASPTNMNPAPTGTFMATLRNNTGGQTAYAYLVVMAGDEQSFAVGGLRGPSIFCSGAAPSTDCKISYGDISSTGKNAGLKFLRCTTAACTDLPDPRYLDTTDQVRGSDIYCSASTDCKIAYSQRDPSAFIRLKFIQCTTADCSTTSTAQALDTDARLSTEEGTNNPAIFCIGAAPSTDCKISYYEKQTAAGSTEDLKFIRCTNADCSSSSTPQRLDTAGSVGIYSGIYCSSSTDCKISYYDETNADLKFIQCTNADCTSKSTAQTLDSTGTVGQSTAIFCWTSTDCKISYVDRTNTDLKFIRCTNADCTSRSTAQTLDTGSVAAGATERGIKTDIFCSASDDCKVVYSTEASGVDNLNFIQCTNADCSSRSAIQTLDTVSATTPSIYCSASTDCKIAYLNGTGNLAFIQCTNASCSTRNSTGVLDYNPIAKVSQVGTTYALKTSSLAPGAPKSGTTYTVALNASGGTTTISNAALVLDQTETTNGITNVETANIYNVIQDSVSGTAYGGAYWNIDFTRNNYQEDGQTVKYFYETVMWENCGKGECGNTFSRLYNATDATAASSEISGFATDKARPRVEITSPPGFGTSKDFTPQWRTGASGTAVSASSARLIVHISNLQVPERVLLFAPVAVFVPKLVKKIKEILKKRRKVKKANGKPRDG